MGRKVNTRWVDGVECPSNPQDKRETLTQPELATLVANVAGTYKKDVEKVLQAYYKVVFSALCNGYKVSIPHVALLTSKTMEACDGVTRKHPVTGEEIVTNVHDAYWKPKIIWRPQLKEAMREKSEGNVKSRADYIEEGWYDEVDEDE